MEGREGARQRRQAATAGSFGGIAACRALPAPRPPLLQPSRPTGATACARRASSACSLARAPPHLRASHGVATSRSRGHVAHTSTAQITLQRDQVIATCSEALPAPVRKRSRRLACGSCRRAVARACPLQRPAASRAPLLQAGSAAPTVATSALVRTCAPFTRSTLQSQACIVLPPDGYGRAKPAYLLTATRKACCTDTLLPTCCR